MINDNLQLNLDVLTRILDYEYFDFWATYEQNWSF